MTYFCKIRGFRLYYYEKKRDYNIDGLVWSIVREVKAIAHKQNFHIARILSDLRVWEFKPKTRIYIDKIT